MKNKALTITVIANMTSNYGESLGNISTTQKVYRNGKVYAIRSRESLKNAIMVQSGLYSDLEVEVDGKVAQKKVSDEMNAENNRALEGGYMNTSGITKIRKSSFYLTDAIAFEPFVNEIRFHTNLFIAQTYALKSGESVQKKKGDGDSSSGLLPYQYEYDKSKKCYSLTIDLDRVGVEENFNAIASPKERALRVKALLDAVRGLSLVVKGNMDNAEPLFVVGGIGNRKTHYFENVVHVENDKLKIVDDLKEKLKEGYRAGMLCGDNFSNEEEIRHELGTTSISEFFDKLKEEVDKYYEGSEN